MPNQSAKLTQSEYRRGTILGLTVAEIFILLLFLLMLVFLVLSQEQIQRQEQQEQEMGQLRVFRDTWEESLAGIGTPEEIVALKRWHDSVVENPQLNETEGLLDQLVETVQERDEAEAERSMLKKENERLQAVSESQQNELEEQQAELDGLYDQNDELLTEAENQRILREKGHNPPCWYEIVPIADGGTREKAFYLFNIAVFDEHMIIRRRDVPLGGAFDDSDKSYAEEAAMLPLKEIQYEIPLLDGQVVESLEPIFNAGKESRVRTYSCVFFVQVWDETSEFAKERWQQAHDRVLEGLFGTFTVRDEPWLLR